MEKLRLLVIFPHPDDESLGLGGTLARYSAEGVETYLVCATRGERGWNGPQEQNPGLEALGRVREDELRCASRHLKLHELTFLDYIDGDVDRADPREIILVLASHIRRIRPHVVITFSADGIYGHPDHIALAQFTAGAMLCAADGGYPGLNGYPPFSVPKYYQMVDTRSMVDVIREKLGGIEMEVDGVVRSHFGWEEWAVTTHIDTTRYFDQAWRAILCHKSQIGGMGALLKLPREILLKIWGEGRFVRVFSLVNGGRGVEKDLFDGLRGDPGAL